MDNDVVFHNYRPPELQPHNGVVDGRAKPNQNAYIERFNRTYQNEVLNAYLFRGLNEVRQITSRWINEYNDVRPHHVLGGLPPSVYATRKLEDSTFELSTSRRSLRG